MARLRHRGLKVIDMTGYNDIPVTEAAGPIMRKTIDADSLLALIGNTLQAGDPTTHPCILRAQKASPTF